jgi:hypothetical protein
MVAGREFCHRTSQDTAMRTIFWLVIIAGIAIWTLSLQRELAAVRKHPAMYREATARMERRLHELNPTLSL